MKEDPTPESIAACFPREPGDYVAQVWCQTRGDRVRFVAAIRVTIPADEPLITIGFRPLGSTRTITTVEARCCVAKVLGWDPDRVDKPPQPAHQRLDDDGTHHFIYDLRRFAPADAATTTTKGRT